MSRKEQPLTTEERRMLRRVGKRFANLPEESRQEQQEPQGLPLIDETVFQQLLRRYNMDGSYEVSRSVNGYESETVTHPRQRGFEIAENTFGFIATVENEGFLENLDDWLGRNFDFSDIKNRAAVGAGMMLDAFSLQFGGDFLPAVGTLEANVWGSAFKKFDATSKERQSIVKAAKHARRLPPYQVNLTTFLGRYTTDYVYDVNEESAVKQGAWAMYGVLDTVWEHLSPLMGNTTS